MSEPVRRLRNGILSFLSIFVKISMRMIFISEKKFMVFFFS
jgi:hypothetical protein